MNQMIFGNESFTFIKKCNSSNEAEQRLKRLKKEGFRGRINFINNKFYLYKGNKKGRRNREWI